MRFQCVFLRGLFLAVIIAGCSPTHTFDTVGEAEAIRTLSRQWNQSVVARDLDAATAYYAPDGIQMAQNSKMLAGRDAIGRWFESWLPDPGVTNTFQAEVVEVAASGELAYERGTYRFAMETREGRIEDAGKYICIWKKIDGQWKVAVDISNSDMPPGGE